MLNNIRIVLVNPSHPGNIGATARAMKNMGFSKLYLVRPELFPHEQATALAAGADDLLKNAAVVDDLKDALKKCSFVYGTSARSRTLPWPARTPRQAAMEITKQIGEIAIVFGREKSGLTNEELSYCHYHVTIPAEEKFSSLNLAQAVQIITYEIRTAILKVGKTIHSKSDKKTATAEQLAGFYTHLEKTLIDIKFIDPKQPKMLMKRLKRLFNRAAIDETELNILRGILTAIHRQGNYC